MSPDFQRHAGFATRWVDGTPYQRAGHLVAEHAGSGAGPRLLLIGHLDTVFEPGNPFQRFERLTDTTARGPGIIDMKGGDVIIDAADVSFTAPFVSMAMDGIGLAGCDGHTAKEPADSC